MTAYNSLTRAQLIDLLVERDRYIRHLETEQRSVGPLIREVIGKQAHQFAKSQSAHKSAEATRNGKNSAARLDSIRDQFSVACNTALANGTFSSTNRFAEDFHSQVLKAPQSFDVSAVPALSTFKTWGRDLQPSVRRKVGRPRKHK